MAGNNEHTARGSATRSVRVILESPQVAGNIGAVARLMENFDAGELYLVNPKADPHSPEAIHRSTHGRHRLEQARVVSSLTEALEGAVYVIAATRRMGPTHEAEDLQPREMAEVVREETSRGEVGLLFGTEDKGLSRRDILACDAVVNIPAQPEYPTLNLSHSVAVCLYEVFLQLGKIRHCDIYETRSSEAADSAMMDRLMDKLQHALLEIHYLRPEKPDHLMFPIRNVLTRARLSRAEAQILMGLAQQIDEFARYGK